MDMEVVVLGVVIICCRAGWRIRRDWVGLNKARRSSTHLKYMHELLARLIDNAYALARGGSPAISPDLRYKVVKKIDRIVVYERVGYGPRRGREFMRRRSGFLRMEDNTETGEARYEKVKWPKYIVAVRGTQISSVKDIIADLLIVIEVACGYQPFYQPLLDEVSALHHKTSDSDGGVCVTGHSLGAFIAVTATIWLAEKEGIVVPTHLFHLPCVSPDVLFTKFVIGGTNGLGTVYGPIPFVGKILRYVFRKVGEVLTRELKVAAIHGVNSVSPSTIGNVLQRRKNLDDLRYVVHVYSNRRDSISNEFIERSKGPGVLPISFTALFLNAVFPNSPGDACHLIAPMIMHTNDRAEGLIQAHKIAQWFLYEPVNRTSKRVELRDPINP